MVSSLRTTRVVTPSGYCTNFLPPPSGKFSTSPLQATISVTLSGAWPTIPWRSWSSCLYREAKSNNKVEIKLKVLVGLGIFLCLPWHFFMFWGYQTVQWDLPCGALSIFEMVFPFHLLIFLPLCHKASQTSVKLFFPEEARRFDQSGLGISLILVWVLKSGCLAFIDCRVILDILESGFLLCQFYYRSPPLRCSIQTDQFSIYIRRCMMIIKWD